MKVSEMKVGDSGYIVPWHVKPIFCLAGYVSLYIRKDISVDCKSGGTSRLFIERGPYGIKIDRLEYLNERSSVKFDIQYLRVRGKPEIPQDIEWVVGWISEEDKYKGDKHIEQLTEIIEGCKRTSRGYKESGTPKDVSWRIDRLIIDLTRLLRDL